VLLAFPFRDSMPVELHHNTWTRLP
jgi:hypothetical protein